MTYFFVFIFFIFGTIIGSFLNVVALRYNTGFSIVTGRSKCFSCSKKLFWYELIPVFSFLFLGGKCSVCKSKISKQYIIVELITGLIFSLIFIKFGFSAYLPAYFTISSILIVMSVYDYLHKIIPDGMVFSFDILALIFLVWKFNFSGLLLSPFLLDFFSGLILFAFFAFFWLVSSGRWMGFGDAKLAIGVGWFLGLIGGISAILFAFWIGAIFSLVIMALQKLNLSNKRLTIKSEIPFAPFIILGLFLELFTNLGTQYLFNFLNI